MDSLSSNTVLTAHNSTYLADNNLNNLKDSGLSQESKNKHEDSQVLFRNPNDNAWIVIERKSSSKIKGYLERIDGARENLILKGIPDRLKIEHVDNAKALLNNSKVSLKDRQIDVFTGLKGGMIKEEEEIQENETEKQVAQNAYLLGKKLEKEGNFLQALDAYKGAIKGGILLAEAAYTEVQIKLKESETLSLYSRVNQEDIEKNLSGHNIEKYCQTLQNIRDRIERGPPRNAVMDQYSQMFPCVYVTDPNFRAPLIDDGLDFFRENYPKWCEGKEKDSFDSNQFCYEAVMNQCKESLGLPQDFIAHLAQDELQYIEAIESAARLILKQLESANDFSISNVKIQRAISAIYKNTYKIILYPFSHDHEIKIGTEIKETDKQISKSNSQREVEAYFRKPEVKTCKKIISQKYPNLKWKVSLSCIHYKPRFKHYILEAASMLQSLMDWLIRSIFNRVQRRF